MISNYVKKPFIVIKLRLINSRFYYKIVTVQNRLVVIYFNDQGQLIVL